MRRISLNARLAHDNGYGSAEVEVVLVRFTHPATDVIVRLSTDPTERLSAEPLAYGTRSSWFGTDPLTQPFQFVLMSALIPDDRDETPGGARLVLDAGDGTLAELLRSTTERATVDIAIVLASSPDHIEFEAPGLKLVSSEGNADSITLTIAADPVSEAPWPAGRMTRSRFPGLYT